MKARLDLQLLTGRAKENKVVDGFADVEENGGEGEVVREARTIEGEAEAQASSVPKTENSEILILVGPLGRGKKQGQRKM